MTGYGVGSTAAQRMLGARYGVRGQIGMADVIDMAMSVIRDRARRLLKCRQAGPVFELLIVNDELADLAACLSDRRRDRDATGREVHR
jgi:hypothetical protein